MVATPDIAGAPKADSATGTSVVSPPASRTPDWPVARLNLSIVRASLASILRPTDENATARRAGARSNAVVLPARGRLEERQGPVQDQPDVGQDAGVALDVDQRSPSLDL